MRPKLMYLAQRIPYPPDKGDKITTFNILKYLSARADVYLAAFVDDPLDFQHAETLKSYCQEVHLVPLSPKLAKLRALPSFLTGKSLTENYFFDRRMKTWIDDTVARHGIHRCLVYSSAMAQYLGKKSHDQVHSLTHYADIDSDKWQQYANLHGGLKKWIYGREAKKLLAFEREQGAKYNAISFVAENEASHFQTLAPELAGRVTVIQNGADTDYFDPDRPFDSPYEAGEKVVVFTGAMDYFPNIDAVKWFAQEIFGQIRQSCPEVIFYIVGSNPDQVVKGLASIPGVKVTGRVPDVRPYLKYASLAVAPLRAARGVQNKVIEAMAMGLGVVCSPAVQLGLQNRTRSLTTAASDANEMAAEVIAQLNRLNDPSKSQAQVVNRGHFRAAVIEEYGWDANLSALETHLNLMNVKGS